jgi:3-oxoacyl-[acyl-carrier protein] reductase
MGMLDGRVAIVTGSARGIGLATASMLSEHGASVMVSDIDPVVARAAADGLPGPSAVFAEDLTAGDAPQRLVDATAKEFGRIDIVVNNAGYTMDAPIHKMDDDAWQRMLDIHLSVPFRLLRAVAPHFREPAKAEAAEGVEVFRKIVNVTSVSGTMGSAAQANYASAKSGVVGLTKSLAKEWGSFKVNCNAVAFGLVSTRLIAAKEADNTIEVGGQSLQLGMPPQLRDAAASLVPLGRACTPQEAAGAIFFLCSPWSNYITGQVLTVTGGLTVGMMS